MADPTLTRIKWRLDTYAGHWLPDSNLVAVTRWMGDNDLVAATAAHPVEVRRGRITWAQDLSGPFTPTAQRRITHRTTPLLTAPPVVYRPRCSRRRLAVVVAAINTHDWKPIHVGACATCSVTGHNASGLPTLHVNDAVAWPCRDVRKALTAAGLPIIGGGPRG